MRTFVSTNTGLPGGTESSHDSAVFVSSLLAVIVVIQVLATERGCFVDKMAWQAREVEKGGVAMGKRCRLDHDGVAVPFGFHLSMGRRLYQFRRKNEFARIIDLQEHLICRARNAAEISIEGASGRKQVVTFSKSVDWSAS
jgi:hypothetical protein